MRSAARLAALVLLFFALVAFGAPSSRSDLSSGPEVDSRLETDLSSSEDEAVDDEGDDSDETQSSDDVDDSDSLSTGDAGRHRSPHGGCPSSMVRVQDYCVDRYEAPNRRGARPLVMQSANDAVSWCADHRKRLCTEDEWIAACEGDDHRAYPYGETHVDGRCNDDKPWRKVDEATLAKWPAPEARDLAKELYQATPSGAKHKCVSGSARTI